MVDLEWPKGSQETPKRPPRAPKRNPREAQEADKTISKDKTSIFQKSMNVCAKINVFEGRGSAWEHNIDPTRLQDKTNNHFEEDKKEEANISAPRTTNIHQEEL